MQKAEQKYLIKFSVHDTKTFFLYKNLQNIKLILFMLKFPVYFT